MAHSPLKMFKQFHNKRVLVSGQGPILEISKNLGFTNVCTVEDIRKAFPVLDVVDQKRRDNMVMWKRSSKQNSLKSAYNLLFTPSVEDYRPKLSTHRSRSANARTCRMGFCLATDS